MVDLDPVHTTKSMMTIEEQMDEEKEPRRRKRIRLFRRTSYFLLFLLMVFIVILILLLRQPAVDRPDIFIVNLDEWERELALEGAPVITDIRAARLFGESRIPGAHHGPFDECHVYGVELCDLSACPVRQNHYFYSEKGEEYHEVISAIDLTYTRKCWATVYLLDGGFEAWEEAGNEIDTTVIEIQEEPSTNRR